MATVGNKKIATKLSSHFSPGPPAVSLAPPPPPAGPVPSPFVYIARSASASHCKDKLKIGGSPALVKGSAMDVEKPGNMPCQGTGGDVVTQMVNMACVVDTGSSSVLVGGEQVACTGDVVKMNLPPSLSGVPQTTGILMMADVIWMQTISGAWIAVVVVLDPISVASGDVVDESVDLAIPGLLPIEWKRLYSTARAREHTPLGRGGWTHSYHQWIQIDGDDLLLRDAGGSTLKISGTTPREPAFHRGSRLVVTRDTRGGATVFSLDTRLTRTFASLGGSRAFLRSIENASGHRILLEYEGERLARIADTAGRTISFTHDGNGHITRLDVHPPGGIKGPSLHTVSFTYDPDGELVRVTDPLGHAEAYAYDAQRRLTKKTGPTGLSFHYLYDPETGRCVRSWGDGGLHAGDLSYDLEKGITRLTGTPEPRVFGWGKDGAVVHEASTDGSFARNLVFDADGLLIEEKNAAGEAYTMTRDERGNVTSITAPLGARIELEYENDQVIRRSVNDEITHYAYDHLGRSTQVTYASSASLSITYDERGRLAAIHGPDGLRGGFTYDDQHNVVEERTPRGGVRRFRHDGLGRPVVFINPLGETARRELDALGRATRLHFPDGSTLGYEYDALGRLLRQTDSLGRVEAFEYAGLKSPTRVTTPDGSIWSLTYDLNERLQQIKNPKSETFDLRYDRSGNVREVRSFDGRIARARHGKNGRIAQIEHPDGTYRSLRYDSAGSLTVEETPHGTVKIEKRGDRVVAYTYDDPAGKSSLVFESDEHGRVVAETQNGRTIRYEYDTRNRLVARALPTGEVTRFSHDEEGNVTSLDHDGYRVELQRDLAGSLLRLRFASAGIEVRRSVDSMARLTREWVGTEQKTLVDRVYVYDTSGALIEKNDSRTGVTRYQYDRNGMLLDASSPRGREAFTYDAGGSLSPTGAAWDIGLGGLLQRTETAEYAHDQGSRRTLERRRDGSETAYLWDCRGFLREARCPDGTRVLFAYDPFGRRIRKEIISPPQTLTPDLPPPPEVKPRVVEYLWSGSCLAAEIDSERGTRVFVYQPATMRPVLQQERGKIYAVITDHLGMPTELIGMNGEVAWSARHSAFGSVTDVERPEHGVNVECPFRLLGQYHDPEVDLCYVRYRYFDAKTARFLSPDPLEIYGGRNLFSFNGSPTTHVDPFGLSCLIIGSPLHDEGMRYAISNIKPSPNTLTVVVHGEPTQVGTRAIDGSWQTIPQSSLLAAISGTRSYTGEGTIRLHSCESGALSTGGVAASVSAAYPNAQVLAPNLKAFGIGEHTAIRGGPVTWQFVPDPAGGPGHHVAQPDPNYPDGNWNRWQGGVPQDYTPPPTPRLPPPPPVA